MASSPTATTAEAALRRITSASLGSDDAALADAALLQARALDRYHRFRIASRKAPATSGEVAGRTEYGMYLGKGAMMVLHADSYGKEGAEQVGPAVRLITSYEFSHPGLTAALRDGRPPPDAVHMEWYDSKRPVADIRTLASRLPGPLPPPLAREALGLLTTEGPLSTEAASYASQAFAFWLGGRPLPAPPAAAAETAAADAVAAPTADAGASAPAVTRTWMSALLAIWSRLTGSTPPAAAASHIPGGNASSAPPSKPATGVAVSATSSTPNGTAAAPAAAAPSAAAVEAAWAAFETEVRGREGPAAVCGKDEVDQAWIQELLLPEWGVGAAAVKAA